MQVTRPRSSFLSYPASFAEVKTRNVKPKIRHPLIFFPVAAAGALKKEKGLREGKGKAAVKTLNHLSKTIKSHAHLGSSIESFM